MIINYNYYINSDNGNALIKFFWILAIGLIDSFFVHVFIYFSYLLICYVLLLLFYFCFPNFATTFYFVLHCFLSFLFGSLDYHNHKKQKVFGQFLVTMLLRTNQTHFIHRKKRVLTNSSIFFTLVFHIFLKTQDLKKIKKIPNTFW